MTSKRFNRVGHVVLGIMAIYTLMPVALVLLTAIRPEGDNSTSFGIPDSIDLGNFGDAWETAQFSTFVWNSILVTIGTVVGATLLSILAGYAFGTMEFKGRDFLFYTFLLSLVLPFESVVISWFYTLREIGQTDSLQALIIPQIAIYLGFGVFWMRTFFIDVPRDLIDAAAIDGANSWQTLWFVLVPIARPAITTLVVLTGMWSWNAYLLPLVMISSQDGLTAPLGLTFFRGDFTTDITGLAAASVIVAAPVIAVYAVLQRSFVRGLLSGAVKA